VAGSESLPELALDMRWSWNHSADDVWRQLDPELWDLTQNPWVILQTVSREKLRHILADPAFRQNVDELIRLRRDSSRSAAGWHPRCIDNA
jgi:starch phosphorylase